jgi:hypothetical protein
MESSFSMHGDYVYLLQFHLLLKLVTSYVLTGLEQCLSVSECRTG